VYVLREQAEPQILGAHDIAAVRRFFAVDEAKDGRLARAVAPEADMLARFICSERPRKISCEP
jgi:hypothetical protein